MHDINRLIDASCTSASFPTLNHTNSSPHAVPTRNKIGLCGRWQEPNDVFFDEYGKLETEFLADYSIAELVQQIQATTDTTTRLSLQTKLMKCFVDKRHRFFQKDFATGQYQQITNVAAVDITLAQCPTTAIQGYGRPSFPADDPKDNQAKHSSSRSTTTASRKRKAQRLNVDKPGKTAREKNPTKKCKTTTDVDKKPPKRYDHTGCVYCSLLFVS